MKRNKEASTYGEYVEHPRYGKEPRFSGLEVDPHTSGVNLHWNAKRYSVEFLRYFKRRYGDVLSLNDDCSRYVPGTAIGANLDRQVPATIAITHYYDIDKVCRGCGRRFIFFALEQKHWYEQLGFPLEAQAVRCVPCRRKLQQVSRARRRYEALSHVKQRSDDETLEMVACSLTLMEEGIFPARQTERVRMLLNRISEKVRGKKRCVELSSRLKEIEDRLRDAT